MGYNNDTFWNWWTWNEGWNPALHAAQDNAMFATNIGEQPSYRTKLVRGFIRSALPEKYTQRRCHFQFNPNTLARDTAPSADGVLPWLQDASQLSIPTGTSASFSFSMLFNRELEVATGAVADRVPSGVPDRYNDSMRKVALTDPSSGDQDNVAGLGVLADIRVLDEIVGVGFYNETAVSEFHRQTRAEVNGTPHVAGGFLPANSDLGDEYIRGNTVFMLQQPIRVVFSSLFMVEGYASNMSVTFTKFNPAMVPIMCTVSIAMNAMYIGVARAKTIVTQYLDAEVEKRRAAAATTTTNTTTAPTQENTQSTIGLQGNWPPPNPGARGWFDQHHNYRIDPFDPITDQWDRQYYKEQ